MFHIYYSNQLDILKTLVTTLMQYDPLKNAFASEIILVQSLGMAQWLQIEIAKSIGISANIKFALPAKFIWDMFISVLPDIPIENSFSKNAINWKIMHRLPMLLKKNEFISLHYYLDKKTDKRKLFQLSYRIADLFDKYLVYRPEWLNSWESGILINGLGEAQKWQSILWCDLIQYSKELGQSLWHRANLYARFMQKMNTSEKIFFKNLPKRIFVCGITSLPPAYLKILEALSMHVEIHLLFTNPCREYWCDIQDHEYFKKDDNHKYQKVESYFLDKASITSNIYNQRNTNPLLYSWGKLGSDHLFLLHQIESKYNIDAFVNIERDNLLHNVQSDILNLKDHSIIDLNFTKLLDSSNKRCLEPTDNSITIHNCHSPQREVEVLQNYLLNIMEKNKNINPRDIIVMVADIDNYIPFIQAVFDNYPDTRYLPFSISNSSSSKSHPAIVAILYLLSLPNNRCISEDILGLLNVSSLANNFSITETKLHLLRRWVNESGIRWGIDDTNIEEFSLPVTGQHTWNFGLQRMLLGHAMESCNGHWEGIIPYDESSGTLSELIGCIGKLLSKLNHWRKVLAQSRSLSEWLPLCKELIDSFFSINNVETEAALLLVQEEWKKLIECGIKAKFDEMISIIILRDTLSKRLEKQSINQYFLAGSINFCTLMPMRAIPFKIICLLGMNNDIYPRTVTSLGFDLMSNQSRKGDRNHRDDDRYLFLEALLSAQDQLYISYIGRTIHDCTECYPSILVTELLEYIGQSFYLKGHEKYGLDESAKHVRMHVEHYHTRMPFEVKNFQSNTYNNSFIYEWLPVALGNGIPYTNFVSKLEYKEIKNLTLDRFLTFWKHPIRAWFQQRLGINFYLKNNNIPNTEPFVLSNSERYKINLELLNYLIKGSDIEQLYMYYHAAGNLPYGSFGKFFWKKQSKEMNNIAVLVKNYFSPSKIWEINFKIKNFTFVGWLKQVQKNGLLRWSPTILSIKDGLSLFLEHLIYCILGGKGTSRMYGLNNSYWSFPEFTIEESIEKLTHYIDGYKEGMQQPIILLAKSSSAWLNTSYNKKTNTLLMDSITQFKARNNLLKVFFGNDRNGECSDIYLQRIFNRLKENELQQIIEAAKKWYLPVLKSVNEYY